MMRIVISAVALLLTAADVHASGVHPDWRAIARSQIIVVAEPGLSEQEFEKAVASNPDSYIDISVRISRTIKGNPEGRTLDFQLYTGNTEDVGNLRAVYKRRIGTLLGHEYRGPRKTPLLH